MGIMIWIQFNLYIPPPLIGLGRIRLLVYVNRLFVNGSHLNIPPTLLLCI